LRLFHLFFSFSFLLFLSGIEGDDLRPNLGAKSQDLAEKLRKTVQKCAKLGPEMIFGPNTSQKLPKIITFGAIVSLENQRTKNQRQSATGEPF